MYFFNYIYILSLYSLYILSTAFRDMIYGVSFLNLTNLGLIEKTYLPFGKTLIYWIFIFPDITLDACHTIYV